MKDLQTGLPTLVPLPTDQSPSSGIHEFKIILTKFEMEIKSKHENGVGKRWTLFKGSVKDLSAALPYKMEDGEPEE